MKTILEFLSENFQFLLLKFSVYLNRRVFVMATKIKRKNKKNKKKKKKKKKKERKQENEPYPTCHSEKSVNSRTLMARTSFGAWKFVPVRATEG